VEVNAGAYTPPDDGVKASTGEGRDDHCAGNEDGGEAWRIGDGAADKGGFGC